MADIYGSYFKYGGELSRTYGLIIANVETSRFRRLSGDIKGNTIFNKNTKQQLLTGNDYSSFPISFDVDIVTDNDSCIQLFNRRKIEKWLFNRREYKKLYLYDQLTVEDINNGVPNSELSQMVDGKELQLYLNCRFLNPERLEYNGGIVGYKATIEADSGLWWQDTIEKTFNRDKDGTWYAEVEVDTDLDDYTYPKVKIRTGSSGGNVSIRNTTDDSSRITQFKGVPPNSTFYVDGSVNYVSNNYYDRMSSRFFPRMLDGKNRFAISGDVASVTFYYNNRRML